MVHAVTARNVYKQFGKMDCSLQGQITKTFGGTDPVVVAVDHVSFEVEQGEIFGVLGSRGSGKSTLISLIATSLLPDKGDIQVFGCDVVKQPFEVQKMLNRVPVEARFFRKLSPMENLLYGAQFSGMRGRETRPRIEEILLGLGLEKHAIYSPMDEKSRGMQQKVAIPRAMLTYPRLLLMDEPTAGLDPCSKKEVQAVIAGVNHVSGTTILLTTGDTVEADSICDRIAIIDGGRIVALDTPEGLKGMISPNGHQPTLEDVFREATGKHLLKAEIG